jgi:hypothetical protein
VLAFAVPTGAALVTLAALPGAANAARTTAHTASAATSAAVATVIPSTTIAVAAADIASVVTSGSTKTITLTTTISVKAGDIIVAGIGPATPDGLIAKVTKVTGETLTATAATLRQAVPQGSFSATAAFTSVASGALTDSLPCGLGGGVVPFEGNATVTVTPTITASWTAKSADVTISASASGTSAAAVDDLPADYACSPGASYVGATTKLAPIQVMIGSIPVVITPQLRWFVEGTVKNTQGITNEVSQTFSVSASLTDDGGKYTTHGAASTSKTTNVTGPPDFPPSSNLASVTMGPVVMMGILGQSGPTLSVGLGSTLSSSASAIPWWTDDATQQATGSAGTPELAVSSATKTLASHSTVAGEAPVPKAGLSFYQTYGTQQGAVRGPGGQIWLIAMMPPQFQGAPTGSQALDEVSPSNGVVNYWAPLLPYLGSKSSQTLLAYDNGAPAFDGSGNAWMIATGTAPGGATSHYLVRYAPGPSTSSVYKLSSSCPSPQGITSAGDGSVWLSCGSSKVVRVTASGSMRTFGLSRVSSVSDFAAGQSGSMWAVGYNGGHATGLVRITPGGGESYYGTPGGITPRGLAGNGSSRVIETATCGSSVCLESVSTGGGLSHVGTVPGSVRTISGPSMDGSGNVWLLLDGSASRTGQYFLRLTSRNSIQVYSFSVPGGCLLSAAGSPAGSSDGSAWVESVSNCTFIGNTATAYIGGVVRFKP